jgi:hypothetical protein
VSKARAALLATLVSVPFVILCLTLWLMRSRVAAPAPVASTTAPEASTSGSPGASNDHAATMLYAHNLMLRKGAAFRVYIRWIRGEMLRTHAKANPSFDDPESFVLQIQKGVIHVNIGDIGNFLNSNSPANTPLKNISIQPEGDLLKIHGTMHKIVPLPIEITGSLSPTPEGFVRFHMTKLDVLKIPLKGLLGSFHMKLSDLVQSTNVPGVQVAENDIIFDTQKVLPPPHIHGQITSVRVNIPDIEVIYGNAPNDEARLARWHNFLRLSGGSLDFGKLTMHNVDLTLIDASDDPWFDLDLVNYQAQLVHGYTRMTAQAGLEVYMPDVDEQAPKQTSQGITLEWLQDRNKSLPIDLPNK